MALARAEAGGGRGSTQRHARPPRWRHVQVQVEAPTDRDRQGAKVTVALPGGRICVRLDGKCRGPRTCKRASAPSCGVRPAVGVENRGTGRPTPLETNWPLAISLRAWRELAGGADQCEAACYGFKVRRGPDRAQCKSLLRSLGTYGLHPASIEHKDREKGRGFPRQSRYMPRGAMYKIPRGASPKSCHMENMAGPRTLNPSRQPPKQVHQQQQKTASNDAPMPTLNSIVEVIIAAQWWHCICCGRLKMICSRTSPSL